MEIQDENSELGNEAKSSLASDVVETKPMPELSAAPSFTPGPWAIKTRLPDLIVGPVCGYVARLFHPHSTIRGLSSLSDTAERCEANARLIAAAPSMYLAMELIRQRHDDKAVSVNFDYCGCRDCETMDKVLALARGQDTNTLASSVTT